MDSIKEHILQLENDLVKSEVRKAKEKINDIVANDFIEVTSSGFEYHYKSGDVWLEQNDSNELSWEIVDFKIRQLSNDCIVAMYKVIKHNELNENEKYTLRSSIWKCMIKNDFSSRNIYI